MALRKRSRRPLGLMTSSAVSSSDTNWLSEWGAWLSRVSVRVWMSTSGSPGPNRISTCWAWVAREATGSPLARGSRVTARVGVWPCSKRSSCSGPEPVLVRSTATPAKASWGLTAKAMRPAPRGITK